MPRSDKKRDVKTTLSHQTRISLSNFAEVLGIADMECAEKVAAHAAQCDDLLLSLSDFFSRVYFHDGKAIIPPSKVRSWKDCIDEDERKGARFPVRFLEPEYEPIKAVSNALDCPMSSTVSILIVHGLGSVTVRNSLMNIYKGGVLQ